MLSRPGTSTPLPPRSPPPAEAPTGTAIVTRTNVSNTLRIPAIRIRRGARSTAARANVISPNAAVTRAGWPGVAIGVLVGVRLIAWVRR
jgi:hypothetical protein